MSSSEALHELLASPHGRCDWPLAYWSRELPFSVTRASAGSEPDLAPFRH